MAGLMPTGRPGSRNFLPPQAPQTTQIGGRTYLARRPQGPGFTMNAAGTGLDQGAQPRQTYGPNDITSEDGSIWSPLDNPGGGNAGGYGGSGGSMGASAGNPYAKQNNERMQLLMSELSNNGQWNEPEIPGPDFSGLQGQQQQLQQTLQQLLNGQGPSIGDVSRDPEANAFRVATQRQADEARAGDAERMAASGVTGGGEADARLAQQQEATGTAVAGFNANLAGRRREQAQQAAVQGAGASLDNLRTQMAQQQSGYDAKVQQADMRRQAAAAQRSQKMQLLQMLMAQGA